MSDGANRPADPLAGECPVPIGRYDRIVMGHGSGGTLSAALVRDVFLRVLDDPLLHKLEDQATVDPPPAGGRVAMTTDAFVVKPPVFPGGDIGVLSVCGTVNDLAVGGARARYLSAAFILEEGTPLDLVVRIASSMAATCRRAGVRLVTADTKVVERGKGDGVFVTTTGIGWVPPGRALSADAARPGDKIVASGPLGDHGIAVLSTREGLELETPLVSDVAPLGDLCEAMLEASPGIRCMRDPTRGGAASALTEIAEASGVGMRLDEASVPLRREVAAVCELLGLDPLYVASEGRVLAVVPAGEVDALVAAMRRHELGRHATVIGEVVASHPGKVTLSCRTGGERWVLRLAGEQLPRIC